MELMYKGQVSLFTAGLVLFRQMYKIYLMWQWNSALTAKVVRHSQQMFKMSAVCSDTSSRRESTGRRSGARFSKKS